MTTTTQSIGIEILARLDKLTAEEFRACYRTVLEMDLDDPVSAQRELFNQMKLAIASKDFEY